MLVCAHVPVCMCGSVRVCCIDTYTTGYVRAQIEMPSVLCPNLFPSPPFASDLHLRQTEKLQKLRSASVFVPLCNVNGKASILYTLRSHLVGTHKGQVRYVCV